MPSGSRTIIVSSGIASSPPFTLGAIPMVSNVAPDELSDSIMSQGVGPPAFIVVGAAPSDATTEIVQSTGTFYPSGGLTDSLAIGRGVTVVGAVGGQLAIGYGVTIDTLGAATNFNNLLIGGGGTSADDSGLLGMANNVAIGWNILLRAQAANNVLIGQNHSALSSLDANQVRIGTGSTVSGNSNNVVAIGNGTTVTFRSVAVGDRATASAGDTIAIGPESPQATGAQSIAIGRAARARALDGICIGSLANNANAGDQSSIAIGINASTFAAKQLVIGGIGNGAIDTVLIGAGNAPNQSPVYAGLTFRTSNVPSAGVPNLAGAFIKIATGTGVGNAIGGAFTVEVPVIQASGTLVQTVVTGLEVLESVTALDTFLQIWDVDNAALERVSVGAANSGGAGFKVLRIPN